MTAPDDLAPQLQHLLQALSHQGAQHLAEAETDLRQTAYLLAEAIDKLGRSFMGIHESVTAQQALLASLQAGASLPAPLQESLDTLRRQSQAHVDAAITGLQFQDMTSQLIGRIVGHVTSLHAVLGAVGDSAAALPADAGDGAALATLATINRMLDERGAALDSALRKSVAQTHMESGDIELF